MIRTATLALFFTATPLLAHEPVIDTGERSAAAPFVIDEPEHSKAIYAELDGDADVYQLTSDVPFDFYAGLTAARVEGCELDQTFSFEVLDAGGAVIDRREGGSNEWWAWFEEFGKRWYWVGPEIGTDFKSTTVYPAGTYTIRVFNEANAGKYVLAVGDQERFTPALIARLPSIGRATSVWWDAASCEGASG